VSGAGWKISVEEATVFEVWPPATRALPPSSGARIAPDLGVLISATAAHVFVAGLYSSALAVATCLPVVVTIPPTTKILPSVSRAAAWLHLAMFMLPTWVTVSDAGSLNVKHVDVQAPDDPCPPHDINLHRIPHTHPVSNMAVRRRRSTAAWLPRPD
jgi:hypothetical protein